MYYVHHLSTFIGAILMFWSQSSLSQSVRIEAKLQRPRRNQVGAVHFEEWSLRNTLLGKLIVN